MKDRHQLAIGALFLGAIIAGGCSQWAGTPIGADEGHEYRNENTVAMTGAGNDRVNRMTALEQERQKLSDALSAEQQKTAGLESQTRRIGDLERQLAVRDQEIAALRRTVADESEDIARLKRQLGQGLTGTDDLTRAKEQMASLTAALSKRDRGFTRLETLSDQQSGSLATAERNLRTSLQTEIARGRVTVQESRDTLTINLSSGALFESGQDTVMAEGIDVLKRIGAVLKDYPEQHVQVEGHTDNVAIRGALLKKFSNNQALSKSRAMNAMRLLEQSGVSSANLESAGYGDAKPVAGNESEAGRQKNRRVEIVVSQLRARSFSSF